MEEQEKVIASLRDRVNRLEGGPEDNSRPGSKGGSSVDDFSIKASFLHVDPDSSYEVFH